MIRKGKMPMKYLLGALAAGTLGGAYVYQQRKSREDAKNHVCQLICDCEEAKKRNASEQEPQKPTSTWLGKISKDAKREQPTTSSENSKTKDWQLGFYNIPSLKQDGEASATPQSENQSSHKPVTEALSKTPDMFGGLFPQEDKPRDSSAQQPANENGDKPEPEAKANKSSLLGGLFSHDDKPRKGDFEKTTDPNEHESKNPAKTNAEDPEESNKTNWLGGLFSGKPKKEENQEHDGKIAPGNMSDKSGRFHGLFPKVDKPKQDKGEKPNDEKDVESNETPKADKKKGKDDKSEKDNSKQTVDGDDSSTGLKTEELDPEEKSTIFILWL